MERGPILMGLFAFSDGPTGEAYTPQEFLQHALDQPFSVAETGGSSLVQHLQESFGAGTLMRALTTNPGRNWVPLDNQNREPPAQIGQDTVRPETDAELIARGEIPLDQDQYKSSQYFRADIPWDASMTVNRARDLAAYSDVRAVRSEMAARRPITGFIGGFAGSALDPINYVPVLGEGAQAWAASRFGVIGGRALIGAADAGLNQGIAGLLSAPIRAQYGDDISWQSQVSQMALGAAIGAGAGALGGIFSVRANARAAATRAEVESALATVRNGQESMATLREAVAGLANDGEVRLGDDALGHVSGLADQIESNLEGPLDRPSGESPAVQRPAHWRQADPTNLEGSISQFVAEGIDKNVQKLVLEMHPASERIVQDAQNFNLDVNGYSHIIDAQRMRKILNRHGNAATEAQRGQLPVTPKDFEQIPYILENYKEIAPSLTDNGKDAISYLGPGKDGNFYYVEEVRAGKKSLAAYTMVKYPPDKGPQTLDRVPGFEARKVNPDTSNARQTTDVPELNAQNGTGGTQNIAQAAPGSKISELAPDYVETHRTADVGITQTPERTSPEALQATREVGTPPKPDDIAKANGVDPKTGEFAEQYQLEQLDHEGRMSADDHAAMAAADENVKAAEAWGEALKAAVTCIL